MVYYDKTKKPVKLGRIFQKRLSPKAKLWEALMALGAKPEVGKKIDTEALKGNPCRVTIEDYTDNEGNTVSGITKVKEPDTESSSVIAEIKGTAGADVEVEDVK